MMPQRIHWDCFPMIMPLENINLCICVRVCVHIPMASSKANRTVLPWSKRSLALFPIHLNPVSVSCSNSRDSNSESYLSSHLSNAVHLSFNATHLVCFCVLCRAAPKVSYLRQVTVLSLTALPRSGSLP